MYVTSASYSGEGSQVIAGCSDGSIQLFHEKYKSGKALQIARISGGCEVTDVRFTVDSSQVVSRSMDGCVRLWDLRFLRKSKPLFVFENLPTDRASSSVAFCDARTAVLGTSVGEQVFLDLSTGETGSRKKIPAKSLIRSVWHSNQLFQTSSDGNVFVFFDAAAKDQGVNKFIHKRGRTKIFNPTASLPIDNQVHSYDALLESGSYRENKQGQIRAVSERPKSQRNLPVDDLYGRTDSVKTELERRAKKNFDELQATQEKILAHVTSADDGIVSRAYALTQPKPVLDFSEAQGAAENLLKKKQYCPRCGLKICTCGYLRSLEEAAKRQRK